MEQRSRLQSSIHLVIHIVISLLQSFAGAWMFCGLSLFIYSISHTESFYTIVCATVVMALSILYIIFNFPLRESVKKTPKAHSLVVISIIIIAVYLQLIGITGIIGLLFSPYGFSNVLLNKYIILSIVVTAISFIWTYKPLYLSPKKVFGTNIMVRKITYYVFFAFAALILGYNLWKYCTEEISVKRSIISIVILTLYFIINFALSVEIRLRSQINRVVGMLLWSIVIIDWLEDLPLNLRIDSLFYVILGGMFILTYMLQAQVFSLKPNQRDVD